MATQGQGSNLAAGNGQSSTSAGKSALHRPTEGLQTTQSTSAAVPQHDAQLPGPKKRRNHRSKKKKANRRQSFLPDAEEVEVDPARSNRNTEDPKSATARPPFYRLGQPGGRNLSETSLASEALLDHRYVALFC